MEMKDLIEKEIYNNFVKKHDYTKYKWFGTGIRHQKTIYPEWKGKNFIELKVLGVKGYTRTNNIPQ